MENYLQDLNDVQREAVTHGYGPSMVIAGPGSGKTRVLTYRIAYLINSGIYPESILALTFTNKAAREMKERISRVVGEQARRVWAGTFHSIFARILRIEAEKIGFPSNFTIYDNDDSRSLITTIVKELHLDKTNYNPNGVRSRISTCKSNLITVKKYRQNEELMNVDRINNRPQFIDVYSRYVERCKQAGAMDFDDLLLRTYELFYTNPDNVLEKYQRRFQFLLVDEFQDTNFLQYAIVKKLLMYPSSEHNVTIVGDDAQSIYAFRGATIDNILNFSKDFPKLKTYKLEQNYRSTRHIVDAANSIIRFNRSQIKKTIWTEHQGGEKIRLIKTMSDNEEGRRVADLIVEYKNRHHIPNREIALLYRTNAQSRVFEEYLRRYNIQYKIYGGLSFYQRKEVKDAVAYLRLAVNPADEEALRRVVNYPKRGVGTSSMDKFSQYASENGISLWDSFQQANLSPRVQKIVSSFQKMILNFSKVAEEQNAFDAANHILTKAGVIDELRKDKSLEGVGRLENVGALLDGIKEFIDYDEVEGIYGDLGDKSLASYLQNIALLTDMDTDTDATDYVTLMSVHAAKGLEFDAIFLTGMEENIFPSFMALETSDGIEEERRLFYVAITRAKKFLTLTYANSRYRYGRVNYNSPSRFINELPVDAIDGAGTQRFEPTPQRAALSGSFGRQPERAKPTLSVPPDFVPASPEEIQTGMQIRHLKFGEGKVISIDGQDDSKVATIFFKEISNPKRRLMLKFAKLAVVD